MKQQKIIFGLLVGLLLTLAPHVSLAGPAVTAAYKVVAVQSTATGSVVSLDVTVTNSGTDVLSSVALEEIDPTRIAPARNTLNVGNLAVGGQFVTVWTLNSELPADRFSSSLPLFLQGTAVDANNNSISVAVEGVAK